MESGLTDKLKEIAKARVKKALLKYIAAGFGLWIVFIIIIILLGYMTITSLLSQFHTKPGHQAGKPTSTAMSEIGSDFVIFDQAQEKYGVSWAVLAAIAKIESGFGKGKNYLEQQGVSEAGAVGYMQFMPTTWSGNTNPKARNSAINPKWDEDPATITRYGGYGVDGDGDGRADPYNPWDAVPAAAKLLKANNIELNPEEAVYAYNHDYGYVNNILAQALQYSIYQVPSMVGIWPLPPEYTEITATFGQTTGSNGKVLWPSGHIGIDLACPESTPLFAVVSGQVVFAGQAAAYGNYVKISTGEGTTVAYAHLSDIQVKTMQRVEQGQQIGLSGNSGRSLGPHLHFEVYVDNRPSDPLMWLRPPGQNY